MGPTQDNFLSWWKLRMLIIGKPDKMYRDLNSKRRTELFATSMWILVSHDNQYVSNLVFSIRFKSCFFTLYVGVLGLDTRYGKVTVSCSPSSHFLLTQPQPEGLSHYCLMQPSDSQHLHKPCSLPPLAL